MEPSPRKHPTPLAVIVAVVAQEFGFGIHELKSPRKGPELVRARQAAMYLMDELTEASRPAMGRVLGNRDHTTIMHGIKRTKFRMEYSPSLREKIGRCAEIASSRINFEPEPVFVPMAEIAPPSPKSPPVGKSAPPAPRPIVREGNIRTVYAGDTDNEWWAANDRRFRAAMARAHPELMAGALA